MIDDKNQVWFRYEKIGKWILPAIKYVIFGVIGSKKVNNELGPIEVKW